MSDLGGPSPVPEALPNGQVGSTPGPGAISDDERVRYLTLLDKALERQLLDPYDYQLRIQELSAATSLDEMQRIVTELPAFIHPNARAGSPVGGRGAGARSRSLTGASSGMGRSGPGVGGLGVAGELGGLGLGGLGLGTAGGKAARSKRSRPWALLVAVVMVILVAFAVLAVFVEHEVHSRQPVTGPGAVTFVAQAPPFG